MKINGNIDLLSKLDQIHKDKIKQFNKNQHQRDIIMMEQYWDTANGHAPHPVKYESEAAVAGFPYCNDTGLNFSTAAAAYSEDDAEYTPGRRGKTSRQDPLSHRIIEKRRRDRMNSCLADLSRLIPPQYLRKGRGRVEKTEIIEMAIRHMKHLQNQEFANKESIRAEQYRQGYHECMQEATKFLLSSYSKEICYQMVDHLKDHCNEIMKGDFLKSRLNTDSISASSESPNGYIHSAPLTQLRDMVPSDIEHSNSADHHDVKDLSFRSQPQQAAVITSTAPIIHIDTNGMDIDSGRASSTHQDQNVHESVLRTVRMRKFSETSTDIEHNNNNYKYKNYIQQRFSQDNHLHEDHAPMNGVCTYHGDHQTGENLSKSSNNQLNNSNSDCNNSINPKKKKMLPDSVECSSCDEKPSTNGITEIKSEILTNSLQIPASQFQKISGGHTFSVPIFALHAQGTFYVPLNIEYNSLLPYLTGIDLLDKSFNSLPPVHPVNINVCFSPTITKSLQRPKIENITNGW